MTQNVRSVRLGTAVVIGFASLGAAACSDVLNPGGGSATTTVSFRTSTSPRAALIGAPVPSFSVIPVTGGGHTVDVQSVEVMFDQVKLERVHSGDERDSDANEDDSDLRSEETFKSGPTTVTMPLTSGTLSPFTQAIPAGVYDELQMKARTLRLKGAYDGTAFDVTVPIEAKLEMRLSPPLTVAATTDRPDITVNVDVLSWFRNSDGSALDPRLLATNSTLRSAFRARVRSSFRAFKDKDRDGVDSDSR